MERWKWVLLGVVVVVAVVVVAVVVVILGPKPVRLTFMKRCRQFEGYDCEKLWVKFEQAYVGKDPCKVPVESYDPLLAVAPIQPKCNRIILWSKTKDIVHAFTKKRDCFITLEDTLLGSILDGLTWCGKEGSSETYNRGCPGWSDCENNPVRSFWNRVSAAFADAACGHVIAMLSGNITVPFDSSSTFGSIEVPRLRSPGVKILTVVLVTQKNAVSDCKNRSFDNLRRVLNSRIQYNCKEVAKSQLLKCASDPAEPCSPCW